MSLIYDTSPLSLPSIHPSEVEKVVEAITSEDRSDQITATVCTKLKTTDTMTIPWYRHTTLYFKPARVRQWEDIVPSPIIVSYRQISCMKAKRGRRRRRGRRGRGSPQPDVDVRRSRREETCLDQVTLSFIGREQLKGCEMRQKPGDSWGRSNRR
jgi:hypothetical protein